MQTHDDLSIHQHRKDVLGDTQRDHPNDGQRGLPRRNSAGAAFDQNRRRAATPESTVDSLTRDARGRGRRPCRVRCLNDAMPEATGSRPEADATPCQRVHRRGLDQIRKNRDTTFRATTPSWRRQTARIELRANVG